MILKNDNGNVAHFLYPISPWGLFSKMRILGGGQAIEDIDNYNRVHEMFQVFSATDSRENDYGSGFGNYWQKRIHFKAVINKQSKIN